MSTSQTSLFQIIFVLPWQVGESGLDTVCLPLAPSCSSGEMTTVIVLAALSLSADKLRALKS